MRPNATATISKLRRRLASTLITMAPADLAFPPMAMSARARPVSMRTNAAVLNAVACIAERRKRRTLSFGKSAIASGKPSPISSLIVAHRARRPPFSSVVPGGVDGFVITQLNATEAMKTMSLETTTPPTRAPSMRPTSNVAIERNSSDGRAMLATKNPRPGARSGGMMREAVNT